MSIPPEPPLVLFDGVCNLCNGAVTFIIDRDPNAALRFASLQSRAGKAAIVAHGGTVPEGDPSSILVVERGRIYSHSAAVLRIAHHLGWPYRALGVFAIVPSPLRDVLYRWIARHRYRWFGKSETCRVPTVALRARFVDSA